MRQQTRRRPCHRVELPQHRLERRQREKSQLILTLVDQLLRSPQIYRWCSAQSKLLHSSLRHTLAIRTRSQRWARIAISRTVGRRSRSLRRQRWCRTSRQLQARAPLWNAAVRIHQSRSTSSRRVVMKLQRWQLLGSARARCKRRVDLIKVDRHTHRYEIVTSSLATHPVDRLDRRQ